MKIAMIGQKGIPAIYGGIERHVEELSRQLVAKGNEVLVYARKWYTPGEIKKMDGINVIHTGCIKTKHLDAITHTFTSIINTIKQRPDIIHFHGVGPSLLSWIPKIFCRKSKIVVTIHCLDRQHLKWGFIARAALRLGERTAAIFADEQITVSKSLQYYYFNEYRKNPTYIPNGIRQMPNDIGSNLINSQFKLQPKKYILVANRLIRLKGIHYLIEAWQYAQTRYPKLFTDYKLAIVGDSANNDNYVEELKKMAKDDNSIIFAGWQSGEILDQLYANSLFFVHPSENEGMPLTVLQAMSFGRPVLVSDIPGHKELVLDSNYWFENTNVYDLQEKLIWMLTNKSELNLVGQKNKKFVQNNFNWKDIVLKTEEVYIRPQNKKSGCYCAAT